MNPYEELGVNKDANHNDIKKAYRRKSKKTHPDAGGSREAFERVQQSYLVLSDPDLRSEYDKTGEFKKKGPDNDPAISILGGILMAVLENDIPDFVNFLEIVNKALRSKIAEMQDDIDKLERMNKRLEKARLKLKYKKEGVGIIQQMLDHKVSENNRVVTKIKRVQLNHERALTIAKDYDYTPDKPSVDDLKDAFGRVKNPFFNLRFTT